MFSLSFNSTKRDFFSVHFYLFPRRKSKNVLFNYYFSCVEHFLFAIHTVCVARGFVCHETEEFTASVLYISR